MLLSLSWRSVAHWRTHHPTPTQTQTLRTPARHHHPHLRIIIEAGLVTARTVAVAVEATDIGTAGVGAGV